MDHFIQNFYVCPHDVLSTMISNTNNVEINESITNFLYEQMFNPCVKVKATLLYCQIFIKKWKAGKEISQTIKKILEINLNIFLNSKELQRNMYYYYIEVIENQREDFIKFLYDYYKNDVKNIAKAYLIAQKSKNFSELLRDIVTFEEANTELFLNIINESQDTFIIVDKEQFRKIINAKILEK